MGMSRFQTLSAIAPAQLLLQVGLKDLSEVFSFFFPFLTVSSCRHVAPGTCASSTASTAPQPIDLTPHSSFDLQDVAFGLPFPPSDFQSTSYAPPQNPTILEDVSSEDDVGCPAVKPKKRGRPASASAGPKSKSKCFLFNTLCNSLFYIYGVLSVLPNLYLSITLYPIALPDLAVDQLPYPSVPHLYLTFRLQ